MATGSTTEKNFETLTGDERILLTDKSYIKTSMLKQLKTQLDTLQTDIDNTMYRREFALETSSEVGAEVLQGGIVFNNLNDDNGTSECKGTVTLTMPHAACYYIVMYVTAVSGTSTVSYGSYSYTVGTSQQRIVIKTDNARIIKISVSDYVVISAMLVQETAAEVPSNKTYVDND